MHQVSKEYDLLLPGITQRGGSWAEFGSGSGIFTLLIRNIAGPEVEIYSVDRDARALEKQRRAFAETYPQTRITYLHSDFTQPLNLPPLDGILMANSLHFVAFDRQQAVVEQLSAHLKPSGGKFLIIEYEAQRGNPWVPYPVDYASFEHLAYTAGLRDINRLAAVPSRFLNEMYSAAAVKP